MELEKESMMRNHAIMYVNDADIAPKGKVPLTPQVKF